ncbi:MAG: DUF3280 domain-containing protein [Janthinobacterium lividum]
MNSQPSSSRLAARGVAFAAALALVAAVPAPARAQAADPAATPAAAPKPPSGDYDALAGATPKTAAFFPFSMDDTSLQGSEEGLSQAERDRLGKLDVILEQMLVATGKFTPVDTSGIAPDALAAVKAESTHLKVWDCNGCDVDEAKKLGSQVSVAAWVQKVSRLILNVNVTIRDVADNRLLYGGSVDIRGDTDESWTRGLRYLIKDRMFQGPHTAGGAGTAAR